MDATIGISDGRNNLTQLFYLFFVLLFIVVYYKKNGICKELKTLSILFVISTIPCLILSSTSVDVLYGWLSITFVPLGIIVGKHFCRIWNSSSHSDTILLIILIPAIVGSIWIVIMSKSFDIFSLGRDYIFSVVIFLPIVYFLRSPYLKCGLLFLILYVVVLSTKRTALIAVCCASLIYIVTNVQQVRRMNIKSFFSITLISLCLVFAIQSVFSGSAKEALDTTFERMSNMDDKSNEERGDIYTKVLSKIEESSFISVLFGHGYNGVTKDIFGHPAHNDYLEITYDYGLITVSIYIVMFLKFLNLYRRKNIKLRENPHIAITFLTILVLNTANCFITNATYVYTCMFCMGWALEYTQLKKI